MKVNKKVIAIDAMGGDNAPDSVMYGLSKLNKEHAHFIIFGDQEKLSNYENLLKSKNISFEIRHTAKKVTSEMEVMAALKVGKSSSMGMALQSVADKESQAIVSSGNTGLLMALAKILIKTLDKIDRPAIASIMPGTSGRTIFLDLGANAECTQKNLVDFAIMGDALARSVFEKNDIKVALLNIGSEDSKGSSLVKKTSEFLQQTLDSYVGFVEGTDICKGVVDVIVTDGFSGNIALKSMEGTAKYILNEFKNSFCGNFFAKIGLLFSFNALKKFKKKIDPRLYNGAMLLGLNGVVVKSHGNSDSIGFSNAVRFALNALNNNLFTKINDQIKKTEFNIKD